MPLKQRTQFGRFLLTARGGGWLWCVLLLSTILISSLAFASDLDFNNIIAKVQSNQSKIKDMYAETETTISSNLAIAGSQPSQKMVQRGKIWTQGQDKTKIEMTSPTRQITINNGRGQGNMDLAKAKEYFNLTVRRTGDSGQYVISGLPKKANKFIGKMELYIDGAKWVPTKIVLYDNQGAPISQTEMEYTKVKEIWVPIKNKSIVSTPLGNMEVEQKYSNIKVNQGINDAEFEVE